MLAPEAAYWLRQQGLEELKSRTPLGGSPTSQVTRYTFADGRSVVWKEQPGMSFDYFQAEADGLAAIRSTHTLCVPNVFFAGETGLLVEDLKPANPGSAFWQELGHQLAGMHQHEGPHFGFHRDNYIGLSPQINHKHHDGFEFFAECRLNPQARAAFDRGLLSNEQVKQVESIAERLSEWISPQPPVLCHGDLWSGNLMSNADGDPAVIDPAAHWGWAVADLAMTRLFGGFSTTFYDAYLEVMPQHQGWQADADALNLYHQLNHLNLFGVTYGPSVHDTLKKLG